MGEARKEALRVGFDRSIKLEFHGAKVSEDDELVTTRELDETLRPEHLPFLRSEPQASARAVCRRSMRREGRSTRYTKTGTALAAMATKAFTSFRTRDNIQHALVALLRAAGKADQGRAEGCPPLQVCNVSNCRSRGAT